MNDRDNELHARSTNSNIPLAKAEGRLEEPMCKYIGKYSGKKYFTFSVLTQICIHEENYK